jgi:ATP-dependent DNA helicase RecQ
VRKHSHQKLSTYGIGKELSRKQWLHVGRQLVQKGLLAQEERYGSLRLTQAAYQALKNHETILGRLQEEERPAQPGEKVEVEYERELFEILRLKRKELADAAHIPPYLVFSDKTLVEMATYLPDTPESMKAIYGMGEVKLEKYGELFLEVVADYCQKHNLVPRAKPNERTASVSSWTGKKLRHVQVGEMYNEGQSVEQIRTAFGVQQGTVIDHLSRYVTEGHELRSGDGLPEPKLSAEDQQRVLQTFEKLGARALKPVFEALGGAVSYEDLKVMRLRFMTQTGEDGFPP